MAIMTAATGPISVGYSVAGVIGARYRGGCVGIGDRGCVCSLVFCQLETTEGPEGLAVEQTG